MVLKCYISLPTPNNKSPILRLWMITLTWVWLREISRKGTTRALSSLCRMCKRCLQSQLDTLNLKTKWRELWLRCVTTFICSWRKSRVCPSRVQTMVPWSRTFSKLFRGTTSNYKRCMASNNNSQPHHTATSSKALVERERRINQIPKIIPNLCSNKNHLSRSNSSKFQWCHCNLP